MMAQGSLVQSEGPPGPGSGSLVTPPASAMGQGSLVVSEGMPAPGSGSMVTLSGMGDAPPAAAPPVGIRGHLARVPWWIKLGVVTGAVGALAYNFWPRPKPKPARMSWDMIRRLGGLR